MEEYLATIKGKAGYKRIALSPLRYAGGKSAAVGLILENFPALPHKRIVSPFFGGGSVELALSKELGFEVVGYDTFGILANFWKQILERPTEFADELKRLVPDKENYKRNRHILLHYWNKIKPVTLDYRTKHLLELSGEEQARLDTNSLLQAVYYYYNSQLSYGPSFLGWPSSVYLNEANFKRIVERVRNFTAPNVSVKQADFQDAIQAHPDDFLFLDPPYYLGEGSKMFKGLYPNCNFAIHHNEFPHDRLRDMLRAHKGGFFLTYNNCSTIRDWYGEFTQIFPSWQYTFGQGEKRVGKNRVGGSTTKESHEIFIIRPSAP